MKKLWTTCAALVTASLASAPATADDVIYASPAAWRLQNYVGGDVRVYYTGTPCFAGQALMPASATPEEMSRFFSLVLTAKATGKFVGFYYETTSGTCGITSFFIQD